MRPLELTVEGFKSYRGRVTFDWRGRRLVGIVGPIGAGKSSILDAIAFALYGKTPAVEGATKSLIHQLCTESHVELRFSVDGQVWRAVRALRKKGASGHQLERLATDEPDAEVLEHVTGDEPMKARVEQLLGMDFTAFCRSVLLAQNRFSEFLKATPTQRDAVLRGVFGFERLEDGLRVAKSRLDRIELELGSLAKERERIVEARTLLEEARETAAAAQARHRELESAVADVEALTKEREAADGEAKDETTRISTLEDVATALPPSDRVEASAMAAEEATARVDAARLDLGSAEQARADRDAELADVTARLGDRQRFRSFEHLVQLHDRQLADVERIRSALANAAAAVTAARARVDELRAAETVAAEEFERADTAETEAAEGVVRARDALMEAKHAEMARELRGTLVSGDPCPVCDQPVHAVPKAGPAPKVRSAETALAKGERAEAKARERKEACAAAAAAATASLGAAEATASREEAGVAAEGERLRGAEADLAATKSQLVAWLGEEGDVRSLFERREAELTDAERAADQARAAIDEARSAFEAAVGEAEGARTDLAKLARQLAGIWGRLDEDRDVPDEPDAIVPAYVAIGETIVARHTEASERREVAVRRADEATSSLRSLLDGLAIPPGQDFRRALTDAGVARGTAAARVEDLARQVARGNDLEREVLAAEARHGIAKRLADDLQPSRFLGFLLSEERADLAELGSEHLEQLTDGAYRFTDDDRFEILDLNAAGARRKPDSLSGGETFLASLALALALAEMVARGHGRLDSFFLDEGFGGLDPEHLDRAMDGIGRLVSEDDTRLVVLVSHVAEMREAIEDLIVLDKHGVTGDTIVRSGTTPGS